MRLNERQFIRYAKPKDDNTQEVTPRIIIPVYIPTAKHRNIKAVDVTDLSQEEQKELESLLQEYHKYLEGQRKQTFSFEDFVSHTTNKKLSPKWRTFKPEQIQ